MHTKQSRPLWLFNHSCDDTQNSFKFVPTRLLSRSEVPKQLNLPGSAMLVTGAFEGLLPSALSRGLSITLPQVHSIYRALKIPALKPGEGSGSKGAVIKRDLVIQIVKKVFGDSISQDEFWRIVNFTAPENVKLQQKKEPPSPEELSAQSLQYLVSCLDPDNCQEFKEVVRHAKQTLVETAKDAGREVAQKELKATLAGELKKAKEKIEVLERAAAGPPREPASSSSARPGLGEHAVPGARLGETHKKVTPKEFKSLFPICWQDLWVQLQARSGQKICPGCVSMSLVQAFNEGFRDTFTLALCLAAVHTKHL